MAGRSHYAAANQGSKHDMRGTGMPRKRQAKGKPTKSSKKARGSKKSKATGAKAKTRKPPKKARSSAKAEAAKPESAAEATPVEVPPPPVQPAAALPTLETRVETDSLGEVRVPGTAYYGAQTQRAVENFPVSGRRADPAMIRAYVAIKKACAMANEYFGKLDGRRTRVICQACDEVLGRGLLMDQWVVDVYQAGAGTSINMNTNEVLANRALELMGKERGDYDILSPNDHVNMSQSTNDTFPTAMHIAALKVWLELRAVLEQLARDLSAKARIFDGVVKSGRTHLQDAVPIRLGQEFAAYAAVVRDCIARINEAAEGLCEVALGGSAVGTGLNTHERFVGYVVPQLGKLVNLPLRGAGDLRQRMQSMLPIAGMSSALRNMALELTRIANDLRLMASGPRTGLAEIELPPVQPGSSIMPGKVNPSLAECLNMICFQVIGNDVAVAMAVQAGQLELNVMMPGMAVALLDSMRYLQNFLPVFSTKCLAGITVNTERCQAYFEGSSGLATVLNQKIGYLKAAEVAKRAAKQGCSLLEIIRREKLLSASEIEALLDRKTITEPGNPASDGTDK